MTNDIILKYNKLLENLSNELDISESRYKQAEERYEAVGKCIGREDSIVAEHSPDIYPQGSFRLGTVIKPITDAEEYDIDLVCLLDLTKNQVSQKQLKEMVGYEIKSYATTNNMQSPPENGKRCWTLNYADGVQFHMDILPSLPDGNSFRIFLENKGLTTKWTELAIAITDNTLPNYDQIDENWLRSNPKGYGEWFKERMQVVSMARREELVSLENMHRLKMYQLTNGKHLSSEPSKYLNGTGASCSSMIRKTNRSLSSLQPWPPLLTTTRVTCLTLFRTSLTVWLDTSKTGMVSHGFQTR